MSDAQQPTAEKYRETAEEIRLAAQRSRSPEVRVQLLDLVERYERMATRAGRHQEVCSSSDGLDGYLIRRAVECATITYDQLKTGTMPGGANRVRRPPAEV